MTAEATVALEQTEADRENKRKIALLRAIGLDRVSEPERELALAIAKRYDLDLLLRHLVLIEGKSYVTRDGLLWIAHRSGQFDGITVTRPVIEGDYWYCEATVWRRDMSHPFVYGGRYPVKKGAFAPEMATKVAESMALRRAFNVSAPSADERWDVDLPEVTPQQPRATLRDVAAQRVAAIHEASPDPSPADAGRDVTKPATAVAPGMPQPTEAPHLTPAVQARVEEGAGAATPATSTLEEPPLPPEPRALCGAASPYGDDETCRQLAGHAGNHRGKSKQSW